MAKLAVKVMDVDKQIFAGECDLAVFPGVCGELGIMAEHARLVSPLKKGKIRIKNEKNEESIDIEKGFLFVSPEGAKVFV